MRVLDIHPLNPPIVDAASIGSVLQDTLYSEALQVQREVLGPDHPDTLLSMNNMAVLCYRKRDFSTAKTLMREAASRRKRVLVRHTIAAPPPTRQLPFWEGLTFGSI